jgi:hypothetical protein
MPVACPTDAHATSVGTRPGDASRLACRPGLCSHQQFGRADLLVQGAHASLLTLKNGQAYSLQQVNCLFV